LELPEKYRKVQELEQSQKKTQRTEQKNQKKKPMYCLDERKEHQIIQKVKENRLT